MSKACAHCKEELGSHYYQDVPREGDLCLKCHTNWLEETQRTLREQERKDPVGGELPEWRVIKKMVFNQCAVVRARTAEEAVDLVDLGGGDWDDEEYDHDMSKDTWDVEDDKGNLVSWGDDA